MNEGAPILNAEQAAQFLGVSKSTLAKMRLYGRGPVYLKLGRRVAYAREDMMTWLTRNRFTSTSEYVSLPVTKR